MRQVRASLDDDDIARLEREAEKAGRSLSEEIRQRLKMSLAMDDARPDVVDLSNDITLLIAFTELQCRGHKWNENPVVARVLQVAVNALFARYGARPGLSFEPGEVYETQMVASDDPDVIGTAIEALVHSIIEDTVQKIRQMPGIDISIGRSGFMFLKNREEPDGSKET